ncbi:MAG TPA: protein kinase [Kofleriaceae bacterium]|nr:protein kinase [Kofleriaceae bacterium]
MSDAAHSSQPPGQFYCPSCEKNFAAGDVCPDDGTRLVRLKVTDPLIGKVLDGRYTIHEKLGQGGMGAVYRGSQHSVGREVAIKLVTPQLVSDHDVIKRFLREAKLASRLSHPNAVAVMDFGQTEDGLFYLVMELVTGRTLDQIIKAEKKLKPERVVRIGMQVCDALEGAHALQIVHRDLKPANIMLLAQGRDLVKVLDFGLAKSLAPDQTSTTMTNAGALLGTPAFMPPELALGQSCDGRADLYSLGCILFLLGSGRLPFVSDSAHELIAMHGMQPAPPMAGVPPQLAEVIDRMLEKDPAKRYQSAAENREALEAAIEAHRIMTPVSGMPRVSAEQSSPANPLATAVGLGVPAKTSTPGRPSASTPATASPVVSATFPTPTPTPSAQRPAHGSLEMEQLVTSDTMVAQSAPPATAMTSAVSPAMSSAIAQPKKSRAALVAVLAAVLVLGGVAALALSGKSSSSSSSEKPAVTAPETTPPPSVQATTPPEVKPPEAKPPEQQPAVKIDTTLPEVGNVVPEVTVTKQEKTTAITKTTKVTKTTPDKMTKVTKTTPDKTTKTSPDKTKTTPDKTKATSGTGSGSTMTLPF